MPIVNCPGGPVAGPVKTASDGALGLTPATAIRNARNDAFDEADDDVIDAIDANYRCRAGCVLVKGAPLMVGVLRQRRPVKRAWWTFWIAYWAEVTVSVTRSVSCQRPVAEDGEGEEHEHGEHEEHEPHEHH